MNPRYQSRQKRDSDGNRLCKVCHAIVPQGRRVYCSTECFHRNTPSIMRHKVWMRDKGICALCGVDSETLPLKPGGYYGTLHKWEMDHIVPVSEGGGLCGLEGYRTLCRPCHVKESGALRKRLKERREVEKAQKERGLLF